MTKPKDVSNQVDIVLAIQMPSLLIGLIKLRAGRVIERR